MEPITFLLDTFIQLADRIINLEKAKLQDRQNVFNEIVKPLFDELEPIAVNYLDFFRKARQIILDNPQSELRNVAKNIQAERDAMIMARIKVREMASQIKEKIDDEQIVKFAISVNNFFYRAPRFPRVYFFGTNATRFLHFLNYAAEHSIEKQEITKYIDLILDNTEHSWALVVQAYEAAKIQSISSPKFIRKSSIKKTTAETI